MTTLTKKELDKILAEHAAMSKALASNIKPLTCKVSRKGAISIGGLNARFPVTLYFEQLKRVLANADALVAFGDANADLLSTKLEPKEYSEDRAKAFPKTILS